MPITIIDPELERRLEDLGHRQDVPVKKGTMAKAILRAAVEDGRGQPVNKWRDRSRRFNKPEAA